MRSIAYLAHIPRNSAAGKVEQVGSHSRQHQHRLQCVMEEA
jgi:ATP-dependent Clp protease adapter protein ClpS